MVGLVQDAEHKLGFKFSQSVAYGRTRQDPAAMRVLKALRPVVDEFAGLSSSNMRSSITLADRCWDLLYELRWIWSEDKEMRQQILVRSKDQSWEGLYPRDLYFSDPEDRDILLASLQELIIAKVENRAANARADIRRKQRARERDWQSTITAHFRKSKPKSKESRKLPRQRPVDMAGETPIRGPIRRRTHEMIQFLTDFSMTPPIKTEAGVQDPPKLSPHQIQNIKKGSIDDDAQARHPVPRPVKSENKAEQVVQLNSITVATPCNSPTSAAEDTNDEASSTMSPNWDTSNYSAILPCALAIKTARNHSRSTASASPEFILKSGTTACAFRTFVEEQLLPRQDSHSASMTGLWVTVPHYSSFRIPWQPDEIRSGWARLVDIVDERLGVGRLDTEVTLEVDDT